MALQKQNVPIRLAGGVDTKSDPKQVVPGKLLLLENGIFTSLDRIKKRNGNMGLSQLIEGSTSSISQGAALATYKNELNLFTGKEFYSFSESTIRWSDKGIASSLSLSSKPIIRNTYQQTTPDGAYHPTGLEVFTWEDSRGGSRYSIIDSITGEIIVADTLIDANAAKPKPLALGNYVVIIYYDSSTHHLRMLPIPVLTPTSPLTKTDLATNVNITFPNYDATLSDTRIYFAYNNSSGGNGITINSIDRFLVLQTPRAINGESASSCIAITIDRTNTQVWVAYHNGTQVKYLIRDSSLTAIAVLAPTLIEANSNTINNITLIAAAGVGDTYYTQNAAATYNNFIKTAHLTNTGTVTGVRVFIRSVGIAGKPFSYNGATYITVAYSSTLQPTYFVLNVATNSAVAKFSPGVGGGLLSKNIVPEASPETTGLFLLPSLIKDLFTTISGAIYTQTGVNSTVLDFISLGAFDNVELGENLIITGGLTYMYDGISVTEYDFNMYPENITYVISPTGGGLTPGTYQSSFTYEWMDNQGQVHISAPSIPVSYVIPSPTPTTFTATFSTGVTSFTVSSTAGLIVGQVISDVTNPTYIPAGTHIISIVGSVIKIDQPTFGSSAGDTLQTVDTSSIAFTVPTLRITDKKPPVRAPVTIVEYRTEESGTTFYRVSSVTNPTLNDTTIDAVIITDITTDFSLIGNPLLYTTGGVLENSAPPAASFVTTYKDRVILLPSENPNQWWPSKQVVPGVPVEFSESLQQNVDQAGGNLVAVARLDSVLILLKQTLLYYVTGTGPDSTGAQNDFSDPQPIACDGGCIDKKSVVLTPAGLMYKSQKGIYLLDRQLGTHYIGADVEAFNSNTIVSSNLIENTQQVRFCLDNGTALVFDYFVKEWSVFTNHNAVDSVIFQGEFTYLQPNGLVLQETPGQFTDNGQFIKLKLTTAWLSFAGLQSFQRVYRLMLLGEYVSPHSLQVSVAYDFNPFATQVSLIQAGAILGTGVYGSDSVYGQTTPYGGAFPQYQFYSKLTRQKCETIQITIEDIQTVGYGENVALSALAFEVGQKVGLDKLPATNSFS